MDPMACKNGQRTSKIKISKRGSAALRTALYQAEAWPVSTNLSLQKKATKQGSNA
jgi:hypothetical protein